MPKEIERENLEPVMNNLTAVSVRSDRSDRELKGVGPSFAKASADRLARRDSTPLHATPTPP